MSLVDPNTTGQRRFCSLEGDILEGLETGKPSSLQLSTLRKIGSELKVFIENPVSPQRSNRQQFGVYNQYEDYIGDVVADEKYFLEEELIAKITEISKK